MICLIYNIQVHFEEVISVLNNAKILLDGLFINFDTSFNSEILRKITTPKILLQAIFPITPKKDYNLFALIHNHTDI